MILTKEFCKQRIIEQEHYIQEQIEKGITLLSGLRDGMISKEDFRKKNDRVEEMIDSALSQKIYFEVQLKLMEND